MPRDVTRLRNIGIMTTVDAGNARCRERLIERICRRAATDGEPLPAERLAPARIGTWTPRSGPFADEPTSLALLEGVARAIDGALLVIDGGRDAPEAAEAPFREMRGRRVPCIAHIDEVGPARDLEALLEALEPALGVIAVPVHVPWHDERESGVIDLLDQRLAVEGPGHDRGLRRVPEQAAELVARMRRRIVDVCAELDESILGASSAGLDIGADELARALRKATLTRGSGVLVVTCGALRSGRGTGSLLDALVTYLPSPADRPPVFGVDPRRSVDVARFAWEGDALSAVVFARSVEPELGRLTWLRIYSGVMHVTESVVVLPRGERGRIERIFVPEATGLVEVEDARPGAIVCVTGPLDAGIGDTVACVRAPAIIDEAHAPAHALPSVPSSPRAATDGFAAPHSHTVWSVARSLRSSPSSTASLRRTRG